MTLSEKLPAGSRHAAWSYEDGYLHNVATGLVLTETEESWTGLKVMPLIDDSQSGKTGKNNGDQSKNGIKKRQAMSDSMPKNPSPGVADPSQQWIFDFNGSFVTWILCCNVQCLFAVYDQVKVDSSCYEVVVSSLASDEDVSYNEAADYCTAANGSLISPENIEKVTL